VHRIVPKKAAYGIERAIYVIDTIINPDLVTILDPIFGHDLIARARLNHRHDPPETTTPGSVLRNSAIVVDDPVPR
jgi:hypothetical protein